MSDLWVFGYGSLMWRPGFDHVEARPATLNGYRRCFCIYSVHHRGSDERPGLVLGLDRGGSCRGMAFRVPARAARQTLIYLRAREQVKGVYREASVALEIHGLPGQVTGLAFIAERAHPSYAGRLPISTQARLIRAARGLSGANLDYFASTLEHLTVLGFRERELERVGVAAGPMLTRGNGRDRSARIKGLVSACQGERVSVRHIAPSERKRFIHRLKLGAG